MILKPSVGGMVLMSSPFSLFTTVVFPALSRPLYEPDQEKQHTNIHIANANSSLNGNVSSIIVSCVYTRRRTQNGWFNCIELVFYST